MNKKATILIPVLALTLLISACAKKPAVNMNVNTNQNINSTETPTPSPSAMTEIDTSNWQTYRNEEIGLEFKYPSEFITVEKNNNQVQFKSEINENTGIMLNIYDKFSTEKDLINYRENEINEKIFSYKFGNELSSGNYRMQSMLNYTNSLGLMSFSEVLIFNENNKYGVGIIIYTINSDSEADYRNKILKAIKDSIKF